uniref:FinTRIM family, member 7 n=1 Tax=Cyprinus carpio TaxID=7962 RepID=A0A8C1TIT9_CYPCA
MAKSSISLAQDQFSCSICLHLVQDPVVIPCGHSYCMSCITGCWDQDDQKGVYSCPQCRQTFTPRPVLCKNTMLAEVLEKLKNTKLQAAHPAQCYTGSVGVECDVCTGRKHKAIKSCLVCLNSYCQDHLEQHETLFRGKRHNLMDDSYANVTRLIRDQEKTEVSRAEEQLKRLEQEIEDLRKRDAELEQLSHTDLHIHFLQVTEI